jgi:hypothetical protein
MGLVPLVDLKTFEKTIAKSAGQKHHYIPVFYLKQWAGTDGRLCEFSRPYKEVKPRRVHPDGTGYERGLYSMNELPPALANYIENRFLQRADDLAFFALSKLVNEDLQFNQPTQSAWSRFIITLLHRSPEGIARLKLRMDAEFIQNVEEFRPEYEERRTAEMPTFDDFIAGLTPADLERMNIYVFQNVMDSQLLGAHLNAMKWSVIRFNDTHHRLLTGDRPLVMSDGLNNPDSHIMMPISPRALFVAVNDERQRRHLINMAESSGLAQRINNKIVRQARKYVYATDDGALPFVTARLGEKAKWSAFE